MALIPLTSGQFAIVDEADFGWLNKFNWYFTHGYARRDIWKNGLRTRSYMHREILKAEKVDHENRNKLDNRRANLRPTTQSLNMLNGDLRRNNTSGHTGVYYNKACNRFRVALGGNYVGSFLTLGEAINARAKAYQEVLSC